MKTLKNKKALCIALLYALSTNSTASALDHLREAMTYLPQEINYYEGIQTEESKWQPFFAQFVDIGEYRTIERQMKHSKQAEGYNNKLFIRISPLLMMNTNAMLFSEEKNWVKYLGVPQTHFPWTLGAGVGDSQLILWGFHNEAEAQQFFERLPTEQGFVTKEAFPAILFGNNDMPTNLREIINPFRLEEDSPPAILFRQKNILYQSADIETITNTQASKANFSELPTVHILLQGLQEYLTPLSDARLLQASFFIPTSDLQATRQTYVELAQVAQEPGFLKLPEEEQINRIKEKYLNSGLPPYSVGVLVDIKMERQNGFIIALSYDDCTQANAAVAILPQRWQE
ncbi:MAG: hypothetical protein Q4A74_09555 [Cardiobacteriaceae bacterium]|nr:hypothetical protein [Cardiobacteriaceae bacterium]